MPRKGPVNEWHPDRLFWTAVVMGALGVALVAGAWVGYASGATRPDEECQVTTSCSFEADVAGGMSAVTAWMIAFAGLICLAAGGFMLAASRRRTNIWHDEVTHVQPPFE